jgi:transposase
MGVGSRQSGEEQSFNPEPTATANSAGSSSRGAHLVPSPVGNRKIEAGMPRKWLHWRRSRKERPIHVQEVIPVKKSKAYRSMRVKDVRVGKVSAGREGQPLHVGVDVSKEDLLVVLRWGMGDFERPWQAGNPLEVKQLVELLLQLMSGREMVVALEPTGTYGDPLRQALSDAGIPVHRVSPKAAHDYAEIFDGVPSQHDGKDAAIVAELSALGKSASWPYTSDPWEQELIYWVDRMEVHRRSLVMWCGRLEGLLARHWPEATRTLELNSAVFLRCMANYGCPSALAADSNAADRLWCWGRGRLSRDKVMELVCGARSTVGVRAGLMEVRRIKESAEEAMACRQKMLRAQKELTRLAANHAVIQAQATVVGVVTACVLWTYLGDPRKYDSAGSYRKAMGLNLSERSSGKWEGRLKISKRGPSEVRRWLYFAAMRLVKKAGVKEWYDAKRSKEPKDGYETMRALIGVMRRLAPALYRVGVCGASFDTKLLFPGATPLAKAA